MLSARVRCAWGAGEQGHLISRLRAVIGAKDKQIAAPSASLEAALARLEAAVAEAGASRDRERRLELRVAELERRLSMDSTDSGHAQLEGTARDERARRAGSSPSGSAARIAGQAASPVKREGPETGPGPGRDENR
jgi:hypothetical protein